MTEEHAPYTRHPEQRRDDGLERIGDVLRRYVDEQGWDRRLLPEPNGQQPVRRVNGRRRDG